MNLRAQKCHCLVTQRPQNYRSRFQKTRKRYLRTYMYVTWQVGIFAPFGEYTALAATYQFQVVRF